MAPTCAGGYEEVVEDKLIGLVGCSHHDIDFVGAICQLWCLKVDGLPRGGVNGRLLGSCCNAELSKRLTNWRFCRTIHQKNRRFCIPQSGRRGSLPLGYHRAALETLFPR